MLIERLSLFTDLIGNDSYENMPYINMAASFFMNSIPFNLAKEFFETFEVRENGLICGSKYSNVVRWKYKCRKISPSMKPLVEDEDSEFYVDKFDPVYWKQNSKLFIYPSPDPDNNEFGYVDKVPSNFIDDSNQNLINVPENGEHIILLNAAHWILSTKFKNKRKAFDEYVQEFDKIISDFLEAMPEVPSVPDFTFEKSFPVKPNLVKSIFTSTFQASIPDVIDIDIDLPEIEINPPVIEFDFPEDIPTFEMPEIELPEIDLSEAFSAIQNAKRFIGDADADTDNIPKGAYWLDDEDPEMVQSAVQLASQEISRASVVAKTSLDTLQSYQQTINSALTRFQAEMSGFVSNIDAQVKKAQAQVEIYIATVNTEVARLDSEIRKAQLSIEQNRTHFEKFGLEVAKFNAKLQANQTEAQQIAARNQEDIQMYQSEIQSYSSEMQARMAEYSTKLQKTYKEFEDKIGLAVQKMNTFQIVSQKYQTDLNTYQSLFQEAQEMYQKYISEFRMFLGNYESQQNN